MNLHTERWKEAQRKEAEYWKQESFRSSEIFFLKTTTEHIPFLKNIEHSFTFTQSRFRKFCEREFETQEEVIVFEGKSSVNYGKEDVEMEEPLLNRIVAWLNRHVFLSDWFVRECIVICKMRP